MIEFILKNRRLRLHPDGVMYCRAHCRGKETKTEKWCEIKFSKTLKGYLDCQITVDGIPRHFSKHRLVKLAHDPTFDIFDGSPSNCIDHKNRIKTDNRIENLHIVNKQQNSFNTDAKGYSWHKRDKKWEAKIMLDGVSKSLGYFEKEEDARNAYLKEKAKLHII